MIYLNILLSAAEHQLVFVKKRPHTGLRGQRVHSQLKENQWCVWALFALWLDKNKFLKKLEFAEIRVKTHGSVSLRWNKQIIIIFIIWWSDRKKRRFHLICAVNQFVPSRAEGSEGVRWNEWGWKSCWCSDAFFLLLFKELVLALGGLQSCWRSADASTLVWIRVVFLQKPLPQECTTSLWMCAVCLRRVESCLLCAFFFFSAADESCLRLNITHYSASWTPYFYLLVCLSFTDAAINTFSNWTQKKRSFFSDVTLSFLWLQRWRRSLNNKVTSLCV